MMGRVLSLKEIESERDWFLTHPPLMYDNVYFLIQPHTQVQQAGLARELPKVHLAPEDT